MEIVSDLKYFCKKSITSIFQFDTDTTFLIKKVSNQKCDTGPKWVNTTLKSIKQINFKNCLKFLSTFNVPEAFSEPCQTPYENS